MLLAQAVQAVALLGAVHAPQLAWQGAHAPVALSANPTGHDSTQYPRCQCAGPLASHVTQLCALGPSHEAQVASQAPQVPFAVTYSFAAQLCAHCPAPTRTGLIHGALQLRQALGSL